jgi:Reverse transcriptase (RNA-dependent DNA polymerase)/gag-polypeptide of LTR copia-type/Pol polyprotein, beta-barrel domain/GAG-pre-integrase domain/Integrase core domain
MSDDDKKTGSSTYHIEKLNETNYRSWAQQMTWILDEKDLLEVVNGTDVKPLAPTPEEVAASQTAQGEYNTAIAAWTTKAKKARSIIGSSITSSVMIYIEGMDSPAEMWTALSDRYNPKTQTTLLQIIREFMTVKMGDDDIDMERHLQRVQRLKRQVEEQGEKVSDNIYNAVLLNSVSDDYKIAIGILESQQQLTPTIIINRILEEHRKLARAGEGKAVMALLSKTGEKPKKSGNSKSKNKSNSSLKKSKDIKCDHCNKTGHSESRCWDKHPELKPGSSGSKDGKKGEAKFAMSATTKRSGYSNPNNRYLDSGASEHFSPHRDLFQTYTEFTEPTEITTAEGTSVHGIGKGRITVYAYAGGCEWNTLELNDVIYAPDMDSNLLSTVTLYDKGYEISMHPTNGVNILKDDTIVANAVREGSLFRLRTSSPAHANPQVAKRASTMESMEVWHKRLAHLGEGNIVKLSKMAWGMKVDTNTTLGVCGGCQEGKQTRDVSHKPAKRAPEPGELLHSDLCGPIDPPSRGKANYFGLFIDDNTRMTYIVALETKTAAELLRRFKEVKSQIETHLGTKVKRLRTDGGGEYEKSFGKYLKDNGIIHEVTAPYTPEQNGVSERSNRTILERTKAILADNPSLPKHLWMEIAQTVVYLKNRSPTTALDRMTPYEAWFGERPNLSHLRTVGCTAWVHIPKEKRVKLDSHSDKGVLIGYGGTNQYRVWVESRNDIVVSRDVIFDEKPTATPTTEINDEPVIHDMIVVQSPPRSRTASPTPETTEESESESESESDDPDPAELLKRYQSAESSLSTVPEPSTRQSGRANRGSHSTRYGDIVWDKPKSKKKSVAKIARIEAEVEPQSFKEAVNHPTRARQWEDAIYDEYNSIVNNGTWTLVPRPANRKVVSSKWVFKYKRDQTGEIVRCKARLVARGFTQVFGLDYIETFSPVAKLASIRILLAIAAVEDLEIHQMDVVTAFLAGDLEEEVYMEPPEGFEEDGNLVCKLQKSIYGLKQAPRVWNQKIRRYLRSIGFQHTHADHCIYCNTATGVIIAMWVDDLVIFGKGMSGINRLKKDLGKEFNMKDLGELKYFLGIQVYRDRASQQIHINQSGYTAMLIKRFNMENSNPVSTPLATGTKLLKSTDGDGYKSVDPRHYQSIIGSQMYAMLCTRPDIAFAISQTSQFNTNPNSTHEAAAKRALRYLNGTMDLGITFSGRLGMKLEGYSDADWAGGEDRRSISGNLFTLAGGTIVHSSKKQNSVALSSTESEYMAVVQAAKESIWIQRFVKELGRNLDNGKVIYVDNQGAIALANNPEHHARTKHIDIQYHFIRECVENDLIELKYCPTEDMVADGLTKALAKDRHWKLAGKMGLMYWESTSPSPDEDLLAGSSKSGSVGMFRAPAMSYDDND